MLISLMPGASRDAALQGLRQASNDLVNASGRKDRVLAYLQWVNSTLGTLRHLIRPGDLEALLLTRRYWTLVSMPSSPPNYAGPATAVYELLNMELDERRLAFDDALRELEVQIKRWSRPGMFVLPDTSMFIRHPDKLEDWDLAPLLPVGENPIHILVPILVVDELDGLKDRGQNEVRGRARYTLAVLDRLVGTAVGPGQLKAADRSALEQNTGGFPRGEVTIEIVLDPPGHARLPINDDEIVERATAAAGLAGRPITLITYDTGQSMRARSAGLNALKLRREVDEEGTHG